jgi:hypothetical protein
MSNPVITAPAARKPSDVTAEEFLTAISAAAAKGCRVIVLDDVGTAENSRVAPERVKLAPSWKLETSPGNCQYGYFLKGPRGGTKALIKALRKTGLPARLVPAWELVK